MYTNIITTIHGTQLVLVDAQDTISSSSSSAVPLTLETLAAYHSAYNNNTTQKRKRVQKLHADFSKHQLNVSKRKYWAVILVYT